MFRLCRSVGLADSQLYNQDNFYRTFLQDVRHAKKEVIIESPFITVKRTKHLLPIFKALTKRDIRVTINTKTFDELEPNYRQQTIAVIGLLQDRGITVLLTVGHHRKLAIIDRQILWEGSLNILSQSDSCEIMRRIDSAKLASQVLEYTSITEWL